MNNRLFALVCGLVMTTAIYAQNFEDYFEDNTLRIDYTFAGNHDYQQIYVDELNKMPQWAGRRHHLAELPLEGNGQITMKDKATGTVIYRHSFSTLFQEWLTTEEATKQSKSFENPFLIPFPKQPVLVEVNLVDTHHKTVATLTHEVDPADALIVQRGNKHVAPHRILQKSGAAQDCIDVAIVAEGYTKDEMDLFYKDAQVAMEQILKSKAFASMKDRFNFYAVGCESEESGVSTPYKNDWRKTALNSHFHTFYSERYLTTLHLKDLHNQLAGIPYEHIIILANTDEYGGGGIYNSYTLTTAHHYLFKPVVVHEFGHSFGGLADEYYYDDQYETQYPLDTEPWEQNITTLVDFDSKWKDMLPDATKIPTQPTNKPSEIYTKVGVFEGAGYCSKGVYRPVQECRMKINEAPDFCPVCIRAIKRVIDFYTADISR